MKDATLRAASAVACMPDGKDENTKQFDPFERFRGIRDASLEAMSKAMIDAVNSESYAQASGAMLDYCLSASAPFREAMEKSMVQVLQQLSLPSRQEITSLAARFTNLEMRMDDMDAKLDRIANAIAAMRQPAPPAPPEPPSNPRRAPVGRRR